MSYFPTAPDAPDDDESTARVLEFGTECADDALEALSSGTAQDIVSVLQDGPVTANDVADDVDTTLQNVHYHLNRLHEAGVVDVVDTVYSEKGREMDVYAVSGSPLVIVAGDDDDRKTVVELLSELTGGAGLLAGVAVVVQRLLGSNGSPPSRTFAGTPIEMLSPGVVVFATGLACLSSLAVIVAFRNDLLSLPLVQSSIDGDAKSMQ
ncbi:ArsR/SmtB family transcription factor [Haloplanus halophilus]|uniref:ArsR/SmtB family transcription factor n=1 Tax=Haloplanus halophilus TaxID=2949993 RepID=UPI0020412C24|nr:helix-turn-helix domain-containing protein [Haloplanus sp. GDY1]